MAGDWIKMRGNLWDDPRVARICDLTDQSEAAVIGGLYWLWATADQHSEDGVMPGLTLRQIDRKTGVQGLGDALVCVGWIADHPEGVRIVRFEEHNGASAKKRCQTAKRVANHKSGNAQVTQQALPDGQKSVSTALPREEKRREEEEEVPTVLVGTDQPPRLPACPNQEIVELYHQHLPSLPRVEVLNDTRKRAIAARWREVCTDKDIRQSPDIRQAALDWFGWYFEHAGKSEFLTGRSKDWRADIDFLITPSKFAKVLEGHYHRSKA